MPMKQRGQTGGMDGREKAYECGVYWVWGGYTKSALYAWMQRILYSPCATK